MTWEWETSDPETCLAQVNFENAVRLALQEYVLRQVAKHQHIWCVNLYVRLCVCMFICMCKCVCLRSFAHKITDACPLHSGYTGKEVKSTMLMAIKAIGLAQGNAFTTAEGIEKCNGEISSTVRPGELYTVKHLLNNWAYRLLFNCRWYMAHEQKKNRSAGEAELGRGGNI